MHSEAIQLIEKEVAGIEAALSLTGAAEDLVRQKNSLIKSLRLLRQLSDYEITPRAVIHCLPFPKGGGGFAEFRIVDDDDTDNPQDWTELELEGKPVTMTVGDIIILNSLKDCDRPDRTLRAKS